MVPPRHEKSVDPARSPSTYRLPCLSAWQSSWSLPAFIRSYMNSPADKIKQLAPPVLRIGFVDRFLHDRSFADLVTLCLGAFGNLVFVVFDAVLWWMNPSPWNGAMTIYFAALMVMGLTRRCQHGKQRQAVMANRRSGVRSDAHSPGYHCRGCHVPGYC